MSSKDKADGENVMRQMYEAEGAFPITEMYGLTREESEASYAAYLRHEELCRLKEEVVEAACDFIDDDCPENREALYIARAALRDFVYEREQGKKK